MHAYSDCQSVACGVNEVTQVASHVHQLPVVQEQRPHGVDALRHALPRGLEAVPGDDLGLDGQADLHARLHLLQRVLPRGVPRRPQRPLERGLGEALHELQLHVLGLLPRQHDLRPPLPLRLRRRGRRRLHPRRRPARGVLESGCLLGGPLVPRAGCQAILWRRCWPRRRVTLDAGVVVFQRNEVRHVIPASAAPAQRQQRLGVQRPARLGDPVGLLGAAATPGDPEGRVRRRVDRAEVWPEAQDEAVLLWHCEDAGQTAGLEAGADSLVGDAGPVCHGAAPVVELVDLPEEGQVVDHDEPGQPGVAAADDSQLLQQRHLVAVASRDAPRVVGVEVEERPPLQPRDQRAQELVRGAQVEVDGRLCLPREELGRLKALWLDLYGVDLLKVVRYRNDRLAQERPGLHEALVCSAVKAVLASL
mmetsp:Transcript_14053/g.40103  ORF Transcript_14053/g.40103 Transcript_14053/m.40103 type:complete len:420 (-) Transcript_14053:172-1431(-)